MHNKSLLFRRFGVLFVALMVWVFGFASVVSANGLDGIGSSPQATAQSGNQGDSQGNSQGTSQVNQTPATAPQGTTNQQVSQPVSSTPTQSGSNSGAGQSGAEVIGSLFEGVSVDKEAASKANAYMRPLAKGANVLFAVILGFASVGMFLLTALDLLYIAVPPIRNFLNPAGAGTANGPTGGMMGGGYGGYGGYGGGYGGYGGMGAMGASANQGGFRGTISRWISDEAYYAVSLLNGGATNAPAFGGGFGGGYGGGFGGGFGVMQQQQEPPKTGSVIWNYLKNRTFFLVMFGVCSVLFSTLIFTDLGVKFGGWILERLMGLKDSIPQ